MKSFIQKLRMNPRFQVMLIGSAVLVNGIIILSINFTKDDPGKRKVERCIDGYWQILDPKGEWQKVVDDQKEAKRCL